MTIYDLFSKRQRRLRGEMPDVFVYDKIPNQLRVQVIHIVRDAIGLDYYRGTYAAKAYEVIHDSLCREYGVFELTKNAHSHEDSLFNFLLQEKSVEITLDVIEVCFKVIDSYVRSFNYQSNTDRKANPDDAISELNDRFKENGVGFQFESGEFIRVDSQFIHAEAVKPALKILHTSEYEGANEEFLKAHEHYRHGRYKECLVDSLKSFESTMKAICKKRSWPYKNTDTAKNLIDICLIHELIPQYLQSQFSAVRSLLESGVPTVRNKLGGHGQGTQTISVPEYLARYTLNLTASNVLLLAEAEKAMK